MRELHRVPYLHAGGSLRRVSGLQGDLGLHRAYMRLCFNWRQAATTFVMGSVVTGVSSLCDIAEYDLTQYRGLLERLGESSLEVEAILGRVPGWGGATF